MSKLAGHLKSKRLYAFSRFNMLWVCPPLIINEAELAQGLDIIEQGLALVEASLFPASESHPAEALARK
jgi:taurine--2-oxoglutarate transaminase